jgi:RNA polymerase sigma-70 factor (ECF subfamily)
VKISLDFAAGTPIQPRGVIVAPRERTVTENDSYTALIGRVRAGDDAAAAEIARRYEPEIRREVRLRLRDPRLRRAFDSMDVCQSVLASFFARAADGQFGLDRPQDLLRLLLTMARNKLVRQVRRQRANRRDGRRNEPDGARALEAVAVDESPSRHASGRELLREARTLLSREEWELAEQRAAGRGWAEIAAELGGTAEARRKQLARAVGRAARRLGLAEESHA